MWTFTTFTNLFTIRQYQDGEWIFCRSGKTTQFGKKLRRSSPLLSISEFEDKNFVYQKNQRHWRKSWRECDISDFERSDWKRWEGGRGGITEAGEREEATTKCLKKLFLQQSSISLHISKCLSCLTMSLFRWPVIPIYLNVSMTNTVVVMITKFVHHYQWEDHHFIFRVSWFSYLNMRWEISWELSLVTFLHRLDLLKFLFLWLTQPFET